MRNLLIGLIGALAALCAHTALAATDGKAGPDYKPGFACPRPADNDPLATAICSDPAMARAELELEKVYYVRRFQDGPGAYHALKVQAVAYDKALRSACSIPMPGSKGVMPQGGASCYEKKAESEAEDWSRTLTGPAAEEAHRAIDQHIALQQRLIDAGYVGTPGTRADGIYGDSTREGIKRWQAAIGDPQTGFISDAEVERLTALGAERAVRWQNRQPSPSPSADAKASPLLRIFQNDMLDIQRDYLEAITGPAKRSQARSDGIVELEYVVNGCHLTGYAKGTAIEGYGLEITPACSVPLTPFLQIATPTMSQGTFGEVNAAMNGDGQVVADCLKGCGNAADPQLGLIYHGSHAENYVNTEVFQSVASDPALNAWSFWKASMKGERDEYLTSGKFNCDAKYQDEGLAAVSGLRVGSIFVGTVPSDMDLTVAQDCHQQEPPGAVQPSAGAPPTGGNMLDLTQPPADQPGPARYMLYRDSASLAERSGYCAASSRKLWLSSPTPGSSRRTSCKR